MQEHIRKYAQKLSFALSMSAIDNVAELGQAREAWKAGKTIYLCGNGGSAGNANHLANDLFYGAGVNNGGGLKVEALSANPSVLTCLANDIGYEEIYAEQIRVKSNPVTSDRFLRERKFAERRASARNGQPQRHDNIRHTCLHWRPLQKDRSASDPFRD